MVEVALDFHLSNELVDESLLTFEDTFGDLLEGAEKIGGFMSILHEGYLLK